MAEKPIFTDCQWPADCECAKRGYEHERNSCAVPQVEAAAAMFGIDAAALTGQAPAQQPPAPQSDPRLWGGRPGARLKATADRFGTVQLLPDTGNLAADVWYALRAVAPEMPHDKDAVRRIMEMGQIGRGLRAEAGYGSSNVTFFSTKQVKLATGAELLAFLTLAHTPAGDAVYWMLGAQVDGQFSECNMHLARSEALKDAINMIADAARGISEEAVQTWNEAPTDDEIKAADC